MQDSSIYKQIFYTNILRLLEEKKLTKEKLSEISGVSNGFLSDLTNAKAYPSLRIMEKLAYALNTPLPELLTINDLDKNTLDVLGANHESVPDGYERISVVLPNHQAFIVKKWAKATENKLKHSKNKSKNTHK